ncbi:Rha family transcriptional regulator [Brevibacillus halotolerans]|uniref:Rha family transcriptional regulator n=1 Tax=Brevibacillus TaxID=55080 RepID=UPI00215C2622|nr:MULTISPECIES: Rha family transcriptional regulator [Brevibacillus]MCR8961636.1 Rha family transcriptional regulator [Brevibacillus laterosporus]MCZ0833791.1 Rha family transcriptional regulator [Brevibacillus halotolerans]
MNQLVFIQNNQVFTDSLKIAEVFRKSHDNVMRDIRNQIEKLSEAGEGEWGTLNFEETHYTHPQNKQMYPKYNLTEDAFALVAMSYVTPEAMKMKIRFLEQFKQMKEKLNQNKVVPLNDRQAIIQSLKLTVEMAEEMEEVKSITQTHGQKLSELEYKVERQITLDSGQQRNLQKAIARKVYELEIDQERRSELFRQLHREIKDRWGVSSYKDVRRKELEQVLRYVDAWMPRKVS